MLGGAEQALKKPVCPQQKSGQNIVPALHSNMDVPVAHNGMVYMPIELAFAPTPSRSDAGRAVARNWSGDGVRVTPAELTGG
jgi:hypothetical protein